VNIRVNEGLVDALGFVIALLLLPHLLFKAQPLLEGVVQLGVRIAELLSAHEALEALAQARARTMPLGERGHHLRVADDEGGGHAERLDELADEHVEHARVRAGLAAVHVVLRALKCSCVSIKVSGFSASCCVAMI
jgi:hypothetical protein